jgi:hypothetical protein
VQAATSDKLDYLDEELPKSWIMVADKLREASRDEPILAVTAKNPSEPSVVSIMRDAGALADCEDDQAIECRAVALLQLFHQLGLVVYFDDVPGMQRKTILDPQWMLDCITYVIRDYQLHRFRRDYVSVSPQP